jgi:hypothetical protein
MDMFKKVLLAAGICGLGSVIASAPASAQSTGQAYISGSSAIVLMNGASQSVGAELSAPSGTYFLGTAGNGEVTITPTLTTTLETNANQYTSLVVDAGLPDSVASLAGYTPSSFTQAAAAALNATAVLDEQVSIIRAGAGINGLD